MKKYGLNELREMFLSFFESKGHLRLPSFSLIPQNDASLLLINSGMAPMKPWFTGEQEPPRRRVCTCQKCVRTGDIDNIGKTARHGTNFEMLVQFFLWRLLQVRGHCVVLGVSDADRRRIDPALLYPSVYHGGRRVPSRSGAGDRHRAGAHLPLRQSGQLLGARGGPVRAVQRGLFRPRTGKGLRQARLYGRLRLRPLHRDLEQRVLPVYK
jgi:hypothetical protein